MFRLHGLMPTGSTVVEELMENDFRVLKYELADWCTLCGKQTAYLLKPLISLVNSLCYVQGRLLHIIDGANAPWKK